jgi:hypothetical protein
MFTAEVNNHPHSGWLDFALKGRSQHHAVFELPSSEDNKQQASPGKGLACYLNHAQLYWQTPYKLRGGFCAGIIFYLDPFPPCFLCHLCLPYRYLILPHSFE